MARPTPAEIATDSSILGHSGSVQEVRREFLVLMEDAVKQPNLLFRKLRLNLTWLYLQGRG